MWNDANTLCSSSHLFGILKCVWNMLRYYCILVYIGILAVIAVGIVVLHKIRNVCYTSTHITHTYIIFTSFLIAKTQLYAYMICIYIWVVAPKIRDTRVNRTYFASVMVSYINLTIFSCSNIKWWPIYTMVISIYLHVVLH